MPMLPTDLIRMVPPVASRVFDHHLYTGAVAEGKGAPSSGLDLPDVRGGVAVHVGRTGLLILAGLSLLCVACGRESAPSYRYALLRPAPGPPLGPTPRQVRWRTSLVENLEHRGAVLTFLRVDAHLTARGVHSTAGVYRSVASPPLFYVALDSPFLVDFVRHQIGTAGVSGITFHPHPDGTMVIALMPHGVDVLGVKLSNSKADGFPWEVTEKAARWTW